MKGRGKQLNDCPLTFPDFSLVDHASHCKTYSNGKWWLNNCYYIVHFARTDIEMLWQLERSLAVLNFRKITSAKVLSITVTRLLFLCNWSRILNSYKACFTQKYFIICPRTLDQELFYDVAFELDHFRNLLYDFLHFGLSKFTAKYIFFGVSYGSNNILFCEGQCWLLVIRLLYYYFKRWIQT